MYSITYMTVKLEEALPAFLIWKTPHFWDHFLESLELCLVACIPWISCKAIWIWSFRVPWGLGNMLPRKSTTVLGCRVIWIRISDPRSVWIMNQMYQTNQWIHDQRGFLSSFDASLIQTDLGSLIQITLKEYAPRLSNDQPRTVA